MSFHSQLLTHIRSILTFALSIAYLGNLAIKSPTIEDLIFVLLLIVLVLSFKEVSGSSRMIGYASFTISSILLLYTKAPLSVWREALHSNLFFVVMFVMVPLLAIPIQHGGYTQALKGVFERYIKTNSRYYLLVSFLSAFVGILVNIAVVPLVYQICRNSRLSSNHKLLSSAISRGFSTCTIWAPTTAGIALVVQLTGSNWAMFFPFAITSGIIIGIVGYVMTIFEERRTIPRHGVIEESISIEGSTPGESNSSGEGHQLTKIIELCAFAIVLISGIAIISWVTGISTIAIVSISGLIYPLIWLLLIKRLPVFWQEFKGDYFYHRLPAIKNEMILFIGAGLLAHSINYSHLGDYVPKMLSYVVGTNALLLTLVILGSSLCISALGVHPIVTVTILGGTVQAAAYGVTPTYLALVLAACWSIGTAISPSSANVIAVSSIVGESPLRVSIHWNGLYALFSVIVLVIFLTIMRDLGIL
ncbi:C4-dicarboxylate ABC transporter [Desulfitobacterium sp. THU1]|uniref:C4-dicarboxylate ABC transporter n=1 Tax=Desulfitobacterium sp. THU1 TaxID=3138072 RepID=UPI00311F09F5